MPFSPVRCRVRAPFLSDAQREVRDAVQENLTCRDDDYVDPTRLVSVAPHVRGGNTYHITRVNGATRRFRWKNCSNRTWDGLCQFIDEYLGHQAQGGFDAPVDMNPVLREAQEDAFYLNAALQSQAQIIATATNPDVDLDAMVASGLICDLGVF